MFSAGSIKDVLLKFFRLENLSENLSGYVEARVELLKLEIREEVAKAMTRVMVLGIMILMAVLCIVFASLGLALYLNGFFEGAHIGFFIVGGIYLILLVLFMSIRKELFQSLEHFLSKHLKHHKE